MPKNTDLFKLNAKIDELITEFVKLNAKVSDQEEKFVTREEFNQKHDLVMTTLDKVLKEVLASRQEEIINSQRFNDHDQEIGGLKKRVKKLEDNQPTQQI
ncbi:MAG TPA: hypothetical protein VJG66_02110 [Patescibacteria group bacterium]|nr:hypothetical protein [Patescibacteria group bacterium]